MAFAEAFAGVFAFGAVFDFAFGAVFDLVFGAVFALAFGAVLAEVFGAAFGAVLVVPWANAKDIAATRRRQMLIFVRITTSFIL